MIDVVVELLEAAPAGRGDAIAAAARGFDGLAAYIAAQRNKLSEDLQRLELRPSEIPT